LFVAAKKRKTRLVANDLWELVKDVWKGRRNKAQGTRKTQGTSQKTPRKFQVKKRRERKKVSGVCNNNVGNSLSEFTYFFHTIAIA
jgi:hypothetical protein